MYIMTIQPRQRLLALYHHLEATTALSTWWPADSRYEIIVGAVLTQNTSWRNVETAIAQLKKSRSLRTTHALRLKDPAAPRTDLLSWLLSR